MRARHLAPVLAVALTLFGCARGDSAERAGATDRTGPDDHATDAASGDDVFTNPVIDDDFPDPDILLVGDRYHAYATNSGSTNVRVATSTDLVSWERGADALPVLPSWANPGHTWAPEVTTPVEGEGYRMYVTVRHAESGRQCIALAVADEPTGPFRAEGDGPFICQLDDGGSIDASSIVHDGVQYLLWKNDGNCCGRPTHIYLQELSPDGLELVGEATQLIVNDQAWEADLVEAPTLWHHEERFHLFYSANSYAGERYAMGHAVADAVTGPYEKTGDGPWVATQEIDGGVVIGPGGQDVVVGPDGRTWLAYHSWDPSISYRRMNLDELRWEGGLPVLQPTLTPTGRP